MFASPDGGGITGPRRLVLGDRSIGLLGEELSGLGVGKGSVLLVADGVLVELGATHEAESSLRSAGYEPVLQRTSGGEPDLDAYSEVVRAARELASVAVVGVGGGSSMDLAKLAAGLATNAGSVEEYLRQKVIMRDSLPLGLAPTTAGTGAEASKNAIVSHENRKFVVGSPRLTPTLALLDPVLTVSCPPAVTAASGLDALAHAVEATLSLWANPFTTLNALAAVRTIARSLRTAYENGSNLPARRAMLYAAYQAGLSINASTLLGHSMAYTIATRTRLPHGVTTGMSLPYCLAYDAPAAAERVAALEEAAGERSLTSSIRSLAEQLGMPGSLREVGLGEDDIPAMVDDCLQKYPRPNNPVPFDRERLLQLYGHFLDGDVDGAVRAMA